jgi:hypothetical protein
LLVVAWSESALGTECHAHRAARACLAGPIMVSSRSEDLGHPAFNAVERRHAHPSG